MTIKQQIETLDKDFRIFRKSVNRRLNPMYKSFLAEQKADKDLQEAKKQGSISISSEAWNVIKWLILIIGALAGVSLI